MPPSFNPDINALLENVVSELADERCVLFLGPDLLINNTNELYYKVHFKELEKKYPKIIHKYFTRDNVFSFYKTSNSGIDFAAEQKVRGEIKKFYETSGDEPLLNLIAQLPFPLIINVSPDNAINKTFDRLGFKHNSAYHGEPNQKKIEPPSTQTPLIYNIFGSVTNKQSIILTHEELFTKIKNLLQRDEIPDVIGGTIKNACSFLFLGMKFEAWYYQLLLSLFNIEVSSSTKLRSLSGEDEETVSIMNNYFQVEFTNSNPIDFVELIYKMVGESFPHVIRKPENKPRVQGSVYLSYAWNDEVDPMRELWVNKVEEALKTESVIVMRDKNELTIQDSITAFMNRIGRGRIALLIVSDKYLHSKWCMYEAWSIFKNDSFRQRAFIIILPDVDLTNRSKYITFWKEETKRIQKEIEQDIKSDYLAYPSLMERVRSYTYILLFIDQFLNILEDQIWFKVEETDSAANDKKFSGLVDKIKLLLNQNDGC